MAWDPGTLLAASESESESSESSPRSSSGMPSAASAWSLLGRNRKRCNRPAHPSSSHISSSHPSLSLSAAAWALLRFRGHQESVLSLAFSASGKLLATTSPGPGRERRGVALQESLCGGLRLWGLLAGTPFRRSHSTSRLRRFPIPCLVHRLFTALVNTLPCYT